VWLIILEVALASKLRLINVTTRNSNMAKNNLCSACFGFSFVLSCSIVISLSPIKISFPLRVKEQIVQAQEKLNFILSCFEL
jgi:hypothetical protein